MLAWRPPRKRKGHREVPWGRGLGEGTAGRRPSASPAAWPQEKPDLQHLELGLLVSRTLRNKFLLFMSPACGMLLQ